MGTTVVRFRDVRLQPAYRATHPKGEWTLPVSPGLTALAGKTVTILLPPVPPNPGRWPCGVARVWHVPHEEVARLTGCVPPFGHVCVCEHQIEVD